MLKELIYKFAGAIMCCLGFLEMPFARIVSVLYPPVNFEKGSFQEMGYFFLVTIVSGLVAMGIIGAGIGVYRLGKKE